MIESTGTPVVNFTVATNRRYRNRDEQMVEESEYHRCVAYGNAADIIGKYVTKGKRMYVEGRLRTRKRQDTNGVDRFSTEIVVDNFIFLDSRPTNAEGSAGTTPASAAPDETPAVDADEGIPF